MLFPIYLKQHRIKLNPIPYFENNNSVFLQKINNCKTCLMLRK